MTRYGRLESPGRRPDLDLHTLQWVRQQLKLWGESIPFWLQPVIDKLEGYDPSK